MDDGHQELERFFQTQVREAHLDVLACTDALKSSTGEHEAAEEALRKLQAQVRETEALVANLAKVREDHRGRLLLASIAYARMKFRQKQVATSQLHTQGGHYAFACLRNGRIEETSSPSSTGIHELRVLPSAADLGQRAEETNKEATSVPLSSSSLPPLLRFSRLDCCTVWDRERGVSYDFDFVASAPAAYANHGQDSDDGDGVAGAHRTMDAAMHAQKSFVDDVCAAIELQKVVREVVQGGLNLTLFSFGPHGGGKTSMFYGRQCHKTAVACASAAPSFPRLVGGAHYDDCEGGTVALRSDARQLRTGMVMCFLIHLFPSLVAGIEEGEVYASFVAVIDGVEVVDLTASVPRPSKPLITGVGPSALCEEERGTRDVPFPNVPNLRAIYAAAAGEEGSEKPPLLYVDSFCITRPDDVLPILRAGISTVSELSASRERTAQGSARCIDTVLSFHIQFRDEWGGVCRSVVRFVDMGSVKDVNLSRTAAAAAAVPRSSSSSSVPRANASALSQDYLLSATERILERCPDAYRADMAGTDLDGTAAASGGMAALPHFTEASEQQQQTYLQSVCAALGDVESAHAKPILCELFKEVYGGNSKAFVFCCGDLAVNTGEEIGDALSFAHGFKMLVRHGKLTPFVVPRNMVFILSGEEK